MNEIFSKNFYGNTVYEWSIAFALIIASFLVGKILYWIFRNLLKKNADKTKTQIDNLLIDIVEKPLIYIVVVAGIKFSIKTLNMSENLNITIDKGLRILLVFFVTWLVARTVDTIIKEYLRPIVAKTEGDMDDHLLPVISKGIKISIWAMGIIVALDNAGYDIKALIAGLGIGGLAFALAAQDTISNFFGGMTIFIDKPFKIGDRIKINGIDGSVKEIGIRTSRIETLEGRTVTVQNSNFLKNTIENISSEPSRKIVLNLGLVYDTGYKKMNEALEVLKKIVADSNKAEEKVLVSFNQFGDFSLNILLIYYIKKGEDILGTQTEINLEIMRCFEEKGLEFAYPTQTIYTKK